MAIPLVNKQRFKETFRILGKPNLRILALVHEPPDDIRYSNNSVIRMIETAGNTLEVKGLQIQNVGRSKATYIMGSFLNYRDDRTYRAYEATHMGLEWKRQVKEKHPVTGLDTGKSVYVTLGTINISVLWDAKAPNDDKNPTQFSTIYSSDPIMEADIVGPFLIRQVKEDYGLTMARAEYRSV